MDDKNGKKVTFSLRFLLEIIIFSIIFTGCGSSPELEKTQPRYKVTLEGSFITESPDEIRFPVKVLFAIDCSLSMGDSVDGQLVGSDPHFLRIEAVRNFIDIYNKPSSSDRVMRESKSRLIRDCIMLLNQDSSYGFSRYIGRLTNCWD